MRKLENLERAWHVIQQNGRFSTSDLVRLELKDFGNNAAYNLRSLKGRLGAGTFTFQKAKGVPIAKLDGQGKPTGKIRPIVLAPVESRIVQRAVLNVLVDQEKLKPYVATPYSFGGIRSSRQKSEQGRSEIVSAVPAAIKAVLGEIQAGRCYIASADIRAFFTRVSKEHAIGVIAPRIDNDAEFLDFLRKAITVELANLDLLKKWAGDFPTEDIGVAQGNSLSPLLGNIALADFDRQMNEGDCRCIRYIDDFIIMAPTMKAANARLSKATKLLAELGMELSPEKSSKGASHTDTGFDFLGVHVRQGLVRPASKAQTKFISSLEAALTETKKSMIRVRNGAQFEDGQSLLAAFKRISGMIEGWGKHYWFCNDNQVFANLDKRISEEIASLLGQYTTTRSSIDPRWHMQLLGLAELARMAREPFAFPAQSAELKPQSSTATDMEPPT